MPYRIENIVRKGYCDQNAALCGNGLNLTLYLHSNFIYPVLKQFMQDFSVILRAQKGGLIGKTKAY